jgi:hypothetical protein
VHSYRLKNDLHILRLFEVADVVADASGLKQAGTSVDIEVDLPSLITLRKIGLVSSGSLVLLDI